MLDDQSSEVGDEIRVINRVKDVAYLEPIVLRETSTTRLVFRLLVTNSQKDHTKPLKGVFFHQKKGKNDEWDDAEAIDLTTLRIGEGVRLEIDTAGIHTLKEWINRLYSIYERNNAPPSPRSIISCSRTPPPAFLLDLPEPPVENLNDTLIPLLEKAQSEGRTAEVARAMSWLLTSDNAEKFVAHVSRLDLNTMEQVNTASGIARIKAALHRWQEHRGSEDEKFWQRTLQDDNFVLSQVFSFPVVIFGREAYVGGKSVNRKGSKLIDFLLTTKLTNNVLLMEIKTPSTKLIGDMFRPSTYRVHSHLVEPVAQVLNYQQELLTNYTMHVHRAREANEGIFNAFHPRCIVISGDTAEFGGDQFKRKAFDLYRNNLRSVEVITFDELFEKTSTLIRLLEGEFSKDDISELVDEQMPF